MLVFPSVSEAFAELGLRSGTKANSILWWEDRLKESGFFKKMNYWQVVNRIPGMSVLSRKASFARLIECIRPIFPSLYGFVPKTFILPYMNSRFSHSLKKGKKRYILKPDNGSLGQGIVILEPGSDYVPDDTLVVAQEYIESFLIQNTKFDLRIYALVVSVTPLCVCVYRDGLARFCSATADQNTLYAKLTNVTFNRANPTAEFANISRLISDVFPVLEKASGVKSAEIWQRIDEAILLSIMAGYGYLVKGEEWTCPKIGYSRCFQILGFDILLDRELRPHVLEINYRPSLEYHRAKERRMKVGMIKNAILLSAPLRRAECALQARLGGWSEESWRLFVTGTDFLNGIERDRAAALKQGRFEQIWPMPGGKDASAYQEVLNRVQQMDVEPLPGFKKVGNVEREGEA
jgi:hypothetical protein